MLRILRNRRFLLTVAIVAGLLAIALWPETFLVDVGDRAVWSAACHDR